MIFDVALFPKFDIDDNMPDIFYVLTKEGRKRYLTNIKIRTFIILNNMYIRNYKGKLVFLDETKFSNERDLYIAIWKIKFKKEISKEGNKEDVLDYVTGNKRFV